MRELGEGGVVVVVVVVVVMASKSLVSFELSLVSLLVDDVSYSFDNNGTVLGVVVVNSS